MSANDQQPAALAVRMLEASEADDAGLVDRLTALVNDVYAVAERGLLREGAKRTTAPALAELIRAEEIAVAVREGQIVGSVRIHDVADDVGEFGMLAAAPEQRGTGIGRALVAFAEQHSRDRGLRAMQLELLVPREWRHPGKELLRAWYSRLGYRRIRTGSSEDSYPNLAPLLATPCDIDVYEKPLELGTERVRG